MGQIRLFEIHLDDPQNVYYPGQSINGTVVLELDGEISFRGIRIKCRGQGHASWREGTGKDKRYYFESEDYVDDVHTVYGKNAKEHGNVMLEAGNYAFEFQFFLPENIPNSFEDHSFDLGNHRECYVRYWLKAFIDRSMKSNTEYKLMLTVASVLDLNTVSNAMAPVQQTATKTACCLCCRSGPITAVLGIDRTGYVPGETIPMQGEIVEDSGRGVHQTKIKLIMRLKLKAMGDTKYDLKTCTTIEKGPISPGESVVINEGMLIPPLPPSGLPGCYIIDIDYYIDMAVNIKGTPFDLNVNLPIVIGTVPPHSVVQQFLSQASPGTNTDLNGQGEKYNMPPPLYRECSFGPVDTTTDDDGQNTTGNMNFAPAYRYYDWMNSDKGTQGTQV